ncbi:MAG: hypothetical protein RL334_986 [Chloroflexota bacterium]
MDEPRLWAILPSVSPVRTPGCDRPHERDVEVLACPDAIGGKAVEPADLEP